MPPHQGVPPAGPVCAWMTVRFLGVMRRAVGFRVASFSFTVESGPVLSPFPSLDERWPWPTPLPPSCGPGARVPETFCTLGALGPQAGRGCCAGESAGRAGLGSDSSCPGGLVPAVSCGHAVRVEGRVLEKLGSREGSGQADE